MLRNWIHMTDKWHYRFLQMAAFTGSWSKDPSTKVGCVIVDQNKTVLAGGFNGFPRGVDDSDARLQDREIKYKLTCHAEANAVASAAARGVVIAGGICYTTGYPCSSCAVLLVQAGIRQICYLANQDFETRWAAEVESSKMVFMECGISVRRFELPAIEKLPGWLFGQSPGAAPR